MTNSTVHHGSPQDLHLDFSGTAEHYRLTGMKSATVESK